MADTKKFFIQINGITESVDAVDSLLKKLENLEQRIDAINQKQATVSTASGGSSGGGSKSRVSDLTAEQKIIDQINRSQEKRQALEGEIGKKLAEEKQAMKELNAEQKSLAAMDRVEKSGILNGGDLPKTMLGMKSELADIKAAMQTMEVGSDEFVKATQRANELNEALKKIEETYGQYGRNVGNYAGSIADALGAMDGITIKIGEQEVKFNSTKEAMRTMKENLKQMTVEGKQGEKAYDDTIKALHELEMGLQKADAAISDLKMSSKGMDEAMDWMQSFGAMGQISQGFSTFFGKTDFQESIQKLMSLQNVLQGLEKIQKQMNTGEGLGKWLGSVNSGIDKMVSKMTGATKTMEGWTASTKTATIAARTFSTVLKGIATLGIGIVLEKAVELFEKLGNAIKGADNSANEAVNSINLVTGELEAQNLELENNIKLIDLKLAKGEISEEEAKKQKIEETNKVLRDQLDTMLEIARLNRSDDVYKQINNGINTLGTEDSIVNADNLKKTAEMWKTYHDAVVNGLNVFEEKAEENGQTLGNWLSQVGASLGIIRGDMEDTEEDFNRITQNIIGQFIGMGQQIINHTGEYTEQEKTYIQDLINAMNNEGFLHTILLNLDKYLGDAAANFKPIIMSMMSQIRSIGGSLGLTGTESEEDRKKRLDKELADLKKHSTARVKTAKSTAKATLDVEKETQRMKLNLMAEGFQKELTRLKYERDEKLRKYKGHKELELLAQQEYDKKSEELRNKHMDEERKAYRDMYQDIFSYIADARQREIETLDDTMEQLRKRAERGRNPLIYDTFGFYSSLGKGKKGGNREGDDMYSVIDEQLKGVSSNMKEIIEDINLYIDEAIRISREEGQKAKSINELFTGENENFINVLKELYGRDYDDKKWDEIKELFGEKQTATFEDLIKTLTVFRLREENALKTFVENEEDLKQYYGQLLQRMSEKDRTFDEPEMYKKYQEWADKRKQVIDAEIQREYLELEESYDNLAKKEQDFYNNKINNAEKGSEEQLFYQKQLNDKLAQLEQEYTKKQQAVHEKYQRELAKVDEEAFQKRTADLKAYFDDMQQEFRDYYEVIVSLSEKMPKRNEFGFINVKETNKGYRETIENLKKLNTEVMQVIFNVGALHSAGKISTEDYKNYTRELMRMVGDIQQKMKEAQEGLSWEGKIQDFFQNLQQYYSAISDSFQTILSEFQNNQDYMIERQMDALDKENEELQKKLEENEKILERHKNNVDKIEGELADARGDRRERLIDALNQEIIAQRRAQAEKEKLEKEQEKIEERQRELEKKQKEYEYQRGLQQILFQTSQAIMQAATNNWPIPAIPLMALAAATGAMQYSLAKQRKPYAEGGILDGLSHENGGISVGNSNIEVEGGEYVVNKRSTANNTELLNLINNSDRQLTPSDLMNFATNMSVSPLDVNMPESSSLETAFVAYAQRPIVVDVREITSRQESVRNVQVLSGIR